MDRVMGLGHVGLYVQDLEGMAAFYRDILGMHVTKQDCDAGVVFFSSDPIRSDHEVVLIRHPALAVGQSRIQQLSFRVASLEALRQFHERLTAADLEIEVVASHVSALGIYFFDPEGNRTEVFWLTGRPCWVPDLTPIDIHRPDADVLDDIDERWASLRDVRIGGLAPAGMPALQLPAR